MLIKRSLLFIGLILLSIIFSACGSTSVEVNENDGKSTSDNKPNVNDPNKIRILYTASLGNFSPKYDKTEDGKEVLVNRYFFSKLSTILNDKRNEGIKTLTISGGNDFGGAFYDEYYGVATAILLDKMKYDIITPNYSEFNNGETIYDAAIKDTSYTILHGKRDFETRSLKRRIKPYHMEEINGHNVGFICSKPDYLWSKGGGLLGKVEYIPDMSLETMKKNAESLTSDILELRNNGAEIVVFVMEGILNDIEYLQNDLLDVDFAIYAGRNTQISKELKIDTSITHHNLGKKKTPLFLYDVENVKALSVLQIDLVFNNNEKVIVDYHYSHKFAEISEDTPEDSQIQKMVDEFISQLP